MAIAALLAALAGCGSGGDERDARHAAQGFYGAASRQDGGAACALLTGPAAQTLARDEKKPCAKAVTSLDLKGAAVRRVQVFETNAAVTFASGEIAYLDRTPQGWRVAAAGCSPRGEQPADCELED